LLSQTRNEVNGSEEFQASWMHAIDTVRKMNIVCGDKL
jgi:hypothetical protein